MNKIYEAVINVSEGRDEEKIRLIVWSAEAAQIVNVDPGYATNRTVITIIGSRTELTEAVKSLYSTASKLIDMNKHTGTHPRMGAVDVCPIIPIKNATIEDAKDLALEIAEYVANSLNIPVYLYAESARLDAHKSLPNIRFGEFEGFKDKIKDFPPDFGKSEIHPSAGVTAIGARNIMLAYNVGVSCSLEQAKKIAQVLRSTGDGKTPGRLKFLQAKAWYLEDFDQVQITCNLHNYKETNMHLVFEEVKREASKIGHNTLGSELIGLCPEEALLIAGEFYAGQSTGLRGLFYKHAGKRQKINLAIKKLGLNSIKKFNRKNIIEYWLK